MHLGEREPGVLGPILPIVPGVVLGKLVFLCQSQDHLGELFLAQVLWLWFGYNPVPAFS